MRLCRLAFAGLCLAGCGGALDVEPPRSGSDGGSLGVEGGRDGGPDATTSGRDAGAATDSDSATPIGDPNALGDAGAIVVGVVAPCLAGGNIVYVDGDPGDPVHPGIATFTYPPGGCGAGASSSIVSIGCPTELGSTTSGFTFAFGASDGGVLAVGVYTNALGSNANDGNEPFESIQAYNSAGGTCDYYPLGRFQIEQLALDSSGSPTSLLISFEQQCSGYGGATLRGCVRYEE